MSQNSTLGAGDLQQRADELGSIVVVGLDPRPELVPDELRARALRDLDGSAAVVHAYLEFNLEILRIIDGLAPAVKFQMACYEAYGSAGLAVLAESVAAARDLGFIAIVDGKRGDIGSSAELYGQALSGGALDFDGTRHPTGLSAHWATATPYQGMDSLRGLVDGAAPSLLGLFVLVRTSNPSSAELQMSPPSPTVAERVAATVASFGQEHMDDRGRTLVGAVVGATSPHEARTLRQLMPGTPFLVPGYGAQGASAADAVAGRADDGKGVFVNSSRGVLSAWRNSPSGWRRAIEHEVQRMATELAVALRISA